MTLIPRKDDFLVRREQKNADRATPVADASFTYFGPEGATERFRFLVVREEGDLVSVQPISDAKFKVGLTAWRWTEREGGTPVTYVVVKTTASRVDLKKA